MTTIFSHDRVADNLRAQDKYISPYCYKKPKDRMLSSLTASKTQSKFRRSARTTSIKSGGIRSEAIIKGNNVYGMPISNEAPHWPSLKLIGRRPTTQSLHSRTNTAPKDIPMPQELKTKFRTHGDLVSLAYGRKSNNQFNLLIKGKNVPRPMTK
jgi:hypothetical protein